MQELYEEWFPLGEDLNFLDYVSMESIYSGVFKVFFKKDHYSTETGAKWFKVAADTSRKSLSGFLFNMGDFWHGLFNDPVLNNNEKYSLTKWRNEAGNVIIKFGYKDFKNVYQNHSTTDLQQWSIQRLVDEQVALQPIHEKYIPKLAGFLQTIMQYKGNVNDILNIQSRIDTGCLAMGLQIRCGVAK